MPATPDLEDDMLRERFMQFRSATLPPSVHSSAEAHATVRHRRRVRVVLGVVAVLVLAVPVSVAALLTTRQANQIQPGPAPTSSVPDISPSPTADAAGSTSDLTVSVGSILLHGSVGSPPGTAWVAVRNNGPATIDQLDLTFTLPERVQTTGSDWNGCTVDSAQRTATCTRPAPPVGGTRAYGFEVTVNVYVSSTEQLTVTVQPHGRTDATPADNTAGFSTATNGGTDISLSAGNLVVNGNAESVDVIVTSSGNNDATFVGLTFQYGAALQPDATSFAGCDRDDAGRTVSCVVFAPKRGTSFTYPYRFTISAPELGRQLSVDAVPDGEASVGDPTNIHVIVQG